MESFLTCSHVVSACAVPACYKALAIYGFVEELVVNDDPEYQVGGRCIPGRNWRDGGWTRGLLKGGEACIAGRNWRGVGGERRGMYTR